MSIAYDRVIPNASLTTGFSGQVSYIANHEPLALPGHKAFCSATRVLPDGRCRFGWADGDDLADVIGRAVAMANRPDPPPDAWRGENI